MKKICDRIAPVVLAVMLVASCGSRENADGSASDVGNTADNRTEPNRFSADHLTVVNRSVQTAEATSGSSVQTVTAAGTTGEDLSLSAFGPATIDGIMAPGEWDHAARIDFRANIPSNDGGGTTPATLYVMNDAENTYFAVLIERTSFGGGANPFFEFDNNNNGLMEDGDDGFGMAVGIYQPPEFRDVYSYTCPDSPAGSAGCSALDTGTTRGILPAGTNDGGTAASNDGAVTIIELSHPLNSGDGLHDFSLRPGDTVGFRFSLRLFSLTAACNYGPSCYADTDIPAAGSGNFYDHITVASSAFPADAQAGIDIKPGGVLNSINPASEGTIPVAILSTGDFDACAAVDTRSLTFGRSGGEESLAFCNAGGEDVNDDGLPDLICHFLTEKAGFLPADFEGIMKGRTAGGDFFTGKDSVRVVPPGQ